MTTTTTTTTTAYSATMADIKAESQQHPSLWSNYGGSVPMPGRYPGSLDSSVLPDPSGGHAARPRAASQHTIEHNTPYPPYPRYSQDESDAYERQQQPGLASHHSYPNLKRTYSQAEQGTYHEMVQDLRDDGSKVTVNHDHKLLSFKRAQDKATVVDQHGRIQQLELSSQLHGMFFLSEMPSTTSDGTVLQPELTCYRRNLFQISGSLITPRGQLSVVTETGETVPANSMEVTISAIESVDGNPVRLIVIPWKTPPPNSPETSQGPDQEPASLPLIPFQDDGSEADGEYAVYPIGWRRLQFRIATANNGRRKELQQHFVLHLKVVATLANNSKIVVTESTTAPIVVRGRSPRNFQARKEIPLLGSSAGSRGQALVETGLGIVAGPLAVKPQDPKARGLDMHLPRTAFTFSAPKMPPSQMGMRSNSYPSWSPTAPVPMPPQMSPPTPATQGNYPPTSMGSDSYHKVPLSGASSFTAEPQEMPLQSSMPSVQLSIAANEGPPAIRTQYAYAPSTTSAPPPLSLPTSSSVNSLAVPRYVDDNPRPSKSPRHASHPSVQSAGSITNNESSSEYRYGSSTYSDVALSNPPHEMGGSNYHPDSQGHQPAPPRDYYPAPNTWTTASSESNSNVAYTNGEARSYSFPEPYKNSPSAPSLPKGPPPPQSYGNPPRGSFEGINAYSWSAA